MLLWQKCLVHHPNKTLSFQDMNQTFRWDSLDTSTSQTGSKQTPDRVWKETWAPSDLRVLIKVKIPADNQGWGHMIRWSDDQVIRGQRRVRNILGWYRVRRWGWMQESRPFSRGHGDTVAGKEKYCHECGDKPITAQGAAGEVPPKL